MESDQNPADTASSGNESSESPKEHLVILGMVFAAAVTTGLFVFSAKHPQQNEIAVPVSDSLPAPAVPAGAPSSPPVPAGASILFVGDMMLDRYIRQVTDERGSDFIFSCIDPLLSSADFAVGNLEGPITSYPSVSEGTPIGSPENFRFTLPATTADTLFRHNIRVVNIGNNHLGDFGAEGVALTRSYLTDAGVSYFGGYAGDAPVYRVSDGGTAFSFVGYNQFGGDSPEQVAETIAAEHAAGRTVVVYAHWGEEYVGPTEEMRRIAALFAANGASLIIGSHPHVVQGREPISGTPVYYSLGNFIFDQYWSVETRQGLALLVRFSNGKVASAEERPVILERDGRTCEKEEI